MSEGRMIIDRKSGPNKRLEHLAHGKRILEYRKGDKSIVKVKCTSQPISGYVSLGRYVMHLV